MKSVKGRSAKQKLGALQESALEELFALPDEALLQESSEDGADMKAQVEALRTSVMETLVKGKRARLENARSRLRGVQAAKKQVAIVRPPVERMKQMIQEIFARDPSLGLAYREGKQQSEADWQSLWDDLVDVGAIGEDDDAHRP